MDDGAKAFNTWIGINALYPFQGVINALKNDLMKFGMITNLTSGGF